MMDLIAEQRFRAARGHSRNRARDDAEVGRAVKVRDLAERCRVSAPTLTTSSAQGRPARRRNRRSSSAC
jgi:hypothetical protein